MPRSPPSVRTGPVTKPFSSILAGKVYADQASALIWFGVQVLDNDAAARFGGAGGYHDMNVCKSLIIFNIAHSITVMADGCANFRRFLVEGSKPNLKKI